METTSCNGRRRNGPRTVSVLFAQKKTLQKQAATAEGNYARLSYCLMIKKRYDEFNITFDRKKLLSNYASTY